MEEVTQPGAVFQSCRNINNPCPDADSWTTCRPWQPRHSCCQKSRDAVWKSISKHGVAARPTRRSCRNLSVSAAPPSLGQPHPLSSVDKSYALVGFPITGGAGVRMKPDLLIISVSSYCSGCVVLRESTNWFTIGEEERRACAAVSTGNWVSRVKPLHCFVLIAVVTRELSNYSRFRCERAL